MIISSIISTSISIIIIIIIICIIVIVIIIITMIVMFIIAIVIVITIIISIITSILIIIIIIIRLCSFVPDGMDPIPSGPAVKSLRFKLSSGPWGFEFFHASISLDKCRISIDLLRNYLNMGYGI